MAKDWYTKFEHDKWKADPGLALCSAATRGVWIEMIGSMMQFGSGKLSGTVAEHARLARLSEADVEAALIELHKFNVAEVHRSVRSGAERDTDRDKSVTVTVVSRYLSRFFDKKENATKQARLRQRRHRSRSCHAVGHDEVTRHSNSNSKSNTEIPPTPLAGETEPSRFMDFFYAYPANKRNGMAKAMRVWTGKNLDAKFDAVMAALDAAKRDDKWAKQFAPRVDLWLEGEPWTPATKPLDSIRDTREADALMVRQMPSDAIERIVEAFRAKHAKYAHWPKAQLVNTPPPEFLAMVKEDHRAA